MPAFEYTAIPAPSRGEKAKGAKTPSERFAIALSAAINDMATDGWEYLRAETLPTEERHGLTGRTTTYHNVLVFRRALAAQPPASQIERQPIEAQPAAAPVEDTPRRAPEADFPARPQADPATMPPTPAADNDATGPRPAPLAAPKAEPPRPNRLGPATK